MLNEGTMIRLRMKKNLGERKYDVNGCLVRLVSECSQRHTILIITLSERRPCLPQFPRLLAYLQLKPRPSAGQVKHNLIAKENSNLFNRQTFSLRDPKVCNDGADDAESRIEETHVPATPSASTDTTQTRLTHMFSNANAGGVV